jgi:hypothetical protein
MLVEGKIKVDEAERLLAALDKAQESGQQDSAGNEDTKKKPKFLHIKVEAKPGSSRRHENVDIKIPIMLLKAGVKLGSIMPDKAHGVFASKLSDKGLDIDLKRLDANSIDALIEALAETSIDIDEEHEKVRIYCA